MFFFFGASKVAFRGYAGSQAPSEDSIREGGTLMTKRSIRSGLLFEGPDTMTYTIMQDTLTQT